MALDIVDVAHRERDEVGFKRADPLFQGVGRSQGVPDHRPKASSAQSTYQVGEPQRIHRAGLLTAVWIHQQYPAAMGRQGRAGDPLGVLA